MSELYNENHGVCHSSNAQPLGVSVLISEPQLFKTLKAMKEAKPSSYYGETKGGWEAPSIFGPCTTVKTGASAVGPDLGG